MKCLVVFCLSLGLAMSFPRPSVRDSPKRNAAKDHALGVVWRDLEERDSVKMSERDSQKRDSVELENQMAGNRRGYGYGGYVGYGRPSGGNSQPSGGNAGNAGNGGAGGYGYGYGRYGYGR
ncbi:uncharacterized protein LOC144630803 [Oculina patagonica]